MRQNSNNLKQTGVTQRANGVYLISLKHQRLKVEHNIVYNASRFCTQLRDGLSPYGGSDNSDTEGLYRMSPRPLSNPDPKDATATMANALALAIHEHRLAPGTKLGEDELGDIYNVSRTVVRAALQSLALSLIHISEPTRPY